MLLLHPTCPQDSVFAGKPLVVDHLSLVQSRLLYPVVVLLHDVCSCRCMMLSAGTSNLQRLLRWLKHWTTGEADNCWQRQWQEGGAAADAAAIEGNVCVCVLERSALMCTGVMHQVCCIPSPSRVEAKKSSAGAQPVG
jgi:hypothetical protein